MDTDGDHPDFDNDSHWPRRLLHVPTMTSYKWEPGNSYGGHREPDYVALSYTWGRFRLQDDENPQVRPLWIRGVPWKIPRVNPSTHFTVEEFENVISEAMRDPDRYFDFGEWSGGMRCRETVVSGIRRRFLAFVERRKTPLFKFLWLDIACIDQRETTTGMLEIGRQARIFRNAKHSYVWLSRLPHTTLQPLLSDLYEAVSGLVREPVQRSDLQFDSEPWLCKALDALSGLRKDPWFSSLWTLQEAFLCNHADIMSRDGKFTGEATLVYPRSWSLNLLFTVANDMILWSERTRTDKKGDSIRRLLELVHETGLGALWYNTPMALLGVSHYRTTTRECDRVYGIMQVFGSDFKMGHARIDADRTRSFTVRELEDELGAAILHSYPILSQMHVYLEPPEVGKGWCVRGNSAVPFIAERGDMFGWDSGNRLDVNIDIKSQITCNLSTARLKDSTWAHISGQACGFDTLRKAWRDADQSEQVKTMHNSAWRMFRCATPSTQMIALDRGTDFSPQLPEFDTLNVFNRKDELIQHDLALDIMNRAGANLLQVLWLGRSQFGNEFFNAGLILFPLETDGIKYWHRIGICIWLISHLSNDGHDHPQKQLLSCQSEDWHHIEGLFG